MNFKGSVKEHSKECDELLIDKQNDYGRKNITKFGQYGVLVRASDKLERLINLIESGKEPNNEKIRDSWVDLRNYAQIGVMLEDNQFDLPLKGE